MAELLGIVSGGAGLLSLSLQLLDSSQKLKGFYHNVKNAPKMLDTLSFDLQTMSLMVRQFERYRQESEDDPLLQRCIFRLQEDVKSINDLVKGLEARLTRSRILGKLSSAFNEPEILRSLNMLERAKSSMLLAHQMYAECVRRRENEEQQRALLAQIDRLALQTANAEMAQIQSALSLQQLLSLGQTSQVPGLNSHIRDRDTDMPSSSGQLVKARKNSPNRKPSRKRFTIALPSWLVACSWRIGMEWAEGGLSVNLQSWHVRPRNSPIFDRCRWGNLPAVKELLASVQASLRDCDGTRHGTLLEHAVSSGNVEICRFLLSEGPFARDVDVMHSSFRTFGEFLTSTDDHLNEGKFRLLIETYEMDIDLDSLPASPFDLPVWWLNCPDTATLDMMLRNQATITKDKLLFNHDSLPCVSLDLGSENGHYIVAPDVFLRMLGVQSTVQSLSYMTQPVRDWMLHAAVRTAGHMDLFSRYSPKKKWLELAQDLLLAQAQPCSVIEQETPLTRLMCTTLVEPRLLRARVSILASAGIDILTYGEDESRIWNDIGVLARECSRVESGQGFSYGQSQLYLPEKPIYGPRPEDWSISYRLVRVIPVYMQISIPGAWSSMLPSFIIWKPRGQDNDTANQYWKEIRTKVLVSAETSQRPYSLYNTPPRGPHAELFERVEDDSGPVALLVHRSRQVRRLARRSSSQPPPVHRKAGLECSVRPTVHQWLPQYHTSPPVSVDEDSSYECPCTRRTEPEGYQYNPWWTRQFCLESTIQGDTHTWEDLQSSRTWEWANFLSEIARKKSRGKRENFLSEIAIQVSRCEVATPGSQ